MMAAPAATGGISPAPLQPLCRRRKTSEEHVYEGCREVEFDGD